MITEKPVSLVLPVSVILRMKALAKKRRMRLPAVWIEAAQAYIVAQNGTAKRGERQEAGR